MTPVSSCEVASRMLAERRHLAVSLQCGVLALAYVRELPLLMCILHFYYLFRDACYAEMTLYVLR